MAAGFRTEPALSVPMDAKQRSAATATADPPLEPPGILDKSHGLYVVPKYGLIVVPPAAHSCILVFPRIIAPALLSRATTVASKSGTQSARIFDPAVVLTPRVAKLSLIDTGIP